MRTQVLDDIQSAFARRNQERRAPVIVAPVDVNPAPFDQRLHLRAQHNTGHTTLLTAFDSVHCVVRAGTILSRNVICKAPNLVQLAQGGGLVEFKALRVVGEVFGARLPQHLGYFLVPSVKRVLERRVAPPES
jgi:hypothetical protein